MFPHFQRIYLSGRWFRCRFTLAGQMLLSSMVLAAVFGVDTTQTLAYQIFAISAALLLLAVMGGWLCRVRVRVKRVLPAFGSVGDAFLYRVEVDNLTPRTQHGLLLVEHLQHPSIAYPEFYRYLRAAGYTTSGNRFDDYIGYPHWVSMWEYRRGAHVEEQVLPPLLPNAKTHVRVEFTPLRRGYLRLVGCSIVCPDPLGLFKTYRHQAEPVSVLVLPKRYPVPALSLPGKRCYQQGGINLAMSVGDAVEFVALRDYRPGDPSRNIHWKSWARRGKPVVKEFQDEFFTRHALVLDTFVLPGGQTRFEEAVSVAASFACQLLTQDTLLDFMFVGEKAYQFTGGRGLSHLDEMLEILACVEACEECSFSKLIPLVMQHTSTLSACICILLEWDEPRRELIRKLRTAGIPALGLLVCEAEQNEVTGEAGIHRLRVGHVAEDLQALAGIAV